MIKFNYSLEVDMGTEKRYYSPAEEISKDLKNIFRLQGPNSSGKSTLMNIIALASHGLNKGKIAPSVKSRMEELVIPGYKELEFEIFIQDPVTKRALRSSKKKGCQEIIVKESVDGGENFKIIIADQFEKKYNLIYDIPENPVGRLNELTGEIKTVQNLFNGKTDKFQNYVERVSNDIEKSVCPEQIEKLRQEQKFDKDALEKYTLTAEKTKVEALKKLSLALKLSELDYAAKDADDVYKKYNKNDDNTHEGKIKKEYNKKKDAIIKDIQRFNFLKTPIGIDANKCDYSRIKELKSALESISEDETNLLSSGGVAQSSIDEIEKIKEFADSMSSSSKGAELEVMSEIIKVLRQFADKNIDLPEFGSLDKFLNNYTEKYRKMNEDYDIKTLKEIATNSKSALDIIKKINVFVATIQPPREDETDSFIKAQKLSSLRIERDNASTFRSDYVRNVSSSEGINILNYKDVILELNEMYNDEYKDKSYDEIKEIYKSFDKDYIKLKEERDEISKRMNLRKHEIEVAESKTTSPFIDYDSEIKILKNEIFNLMSSFHTANRKLEAIVNKKYGSYQKDDSFFRSVWVYLGNRLKNIKHLDKEYVASEVNLIDGYILTEDGTKIYLSDMGTGQSQLSYLKSLLSADDDRMIIALFDEVATMTDSTLEDLFQKFEELQKDGKLMVGMTVSPADNIEVKSYGI